MASSDNKNLQISCRVLRKAEISSLNSLNGLYMRMHRRSVNEATAAPTASGTTAGGEYFVISISCAATVCSHKPEMIGQAGREFRYFSYHRNIIRA